MKKRSMMMVAAAAGLMALASPAGAVDAKCDSYPNVCVGAVTLTPETAAPVAPVAAPAATVASVQVAGRQQLPVTGTDAMGLAAAGAAMVGAGVLLTRRSKAATSDLS